MAQTYQDPRFRQIVGVVRESRAMNVGWAVTGIMIGLGLLMLINGIIRAGNAWSPDYSPVIFGGSLVALGLQFGAILLVGQAVVTAIARATAESVVRR